MFLLVGGDTYDYRNYLGKNSISFIPSLYVTTSDIAKFVPVTQLYTDWMEIPYQIWQSAASLFEQALNLT